MVNSSDDLNNLLAQPNFLVMAVGIIHMKARIELTKQGKIF